MKSDIFDYMNTKTRPGTTLAPRDHMEPWKSQWQWNRSCSTMPPGIFSSGYYMRYKLNEGKNNIEVHIEHHLKEFVNDLIIKQVPEDQWYFRSRGHIVGSRLLQINELEKRKARSIEWGPIAKKNGLSDRESDELAIACMQMILPEMTVDMKHIAKFITERWTRGIGGGPKWSDVSNLDKSQFEQILSNVKGVLERIRDEPGVMFDIEYYPGKRDRADSITHETFPAIIEDYTVEYARQVIFGMPLSTITLFLPKPNKKRVGSSWINLTKEIAKCDLEVYYPYDIGGEIYVKASELFLNNRVFHAFDAHQWDSMVAHELGHGFQAFMINLGGTLQLPSGIGPTSWLGSMASIIQNRHHRGVMIGTSDDMNFFPDNPNDRLDNVPFIEETVDDTEAHFILGLRYKENPIRPRVEGAKLVKDKREEVESLDLSTDWQDAMFKGVRDIRTEAAVTGCWHGWFGDRSILDAIRKIDAADILSPGVLIDQMVDKLAHGDEAFAWAEREGVKRVFTS